MNMKRLRFISILLMTILGFSAIVIGILSKGGSAIDSTLLYSIISVGGGALFGSSLTMFVEMMMGTDISDIRNYLFKKEKLESAPDYLDVVSGVWHVYYLTSSDSKKIWKNTTYTLTKGNGQNTLTGYYNVADQLGKGRKYQLECGIRGTSLILISTPGEGTEFSGIELVPKAINTHLRAHVGVGLLETWDGELAISYAIYSRKKLVDRANLTNEDFELLDNILERTMKTQKIRNLV